MKTLSALMVVLALAVVPCVAQQPNSPSGTLKINGNDGPPYPIVGVFVYGGTNATIEINGGANVVFALAQTPTLTINSFPFLGGVVDLDIVNYPVEMVMDGFGVAPWEFKTNTFGVFTRNIPVPSNISANTSAALQAAVQNPSSPFGITLTAATSIFTAPGLTPITYALGDDNCVFQNTQSQFGFNIPFYATTYTGCYVCANGYLTFGQASTDFTPTNAKMHSQMPRISPFWSDLDCGQPQAGDVTLVVDQIDPANPVLTFKYDHIPDWPTGVNGGLAYHTFGARIDISSGDVEIHSYSANPAGNYDTMTGISAGNSLDPTGAGSLDLSALLGSGNPYVGQPNEGIYEGFEGVTSITGAFPPNHWFDLTGLYWRYSAVGAGMTGAFYIMSPFMPADPNNP